MDVAIRMLGTTFDTSVATTEACSASLGEDGMRSLAVLKMQHCTPAKMGRVFFAGSIVAPCNEQIVKKEVMAQAMIEICKHLLHV